MSASSTSSMFTKPLSLFHGRFIEILPGGSSGGSTAITTGHAPTSSGTSRCVTTQSGGTVPTIGVPGRVRETVRAKRLTTIYKTRAIHFYAEWMPLHSPDALPGKALQKIHHTRKVDICRDIDGKKDGTLLNSVAQPKPDSLLLSSATRSTSYTMTRTVECPPPARNFWNVNCPSTCDAATHHRN